MNNKITLRLTEAGPPAIFIYAPYEMKYFFEIKIREKEGKIQQEKNKQDVIDLVKGIIAILQKMSVFVLVLLKLYQC